MEDIKLVMKKSNYDPVFKDGEEVLQYAIEMMSSNQKRYHKTINPQEPAGILRMDTRQIWQVYLKK